MGSAISRTSLRRFRDGAAQGCWYGGVCSAPVTLIVTGELVGCAKEEGTVFRVAGLVEPQHGEDIAGGPGNRLVALEEMLDRGIERGRDPRDIAAELTRPVCFPLSNGAAADLACDCKLILSQAAGAAQSPDTRADGRIFQHETIMRQSH